MLNYRLIHPPLLAALANTGHGSRVLLADGNYPASTLAPPRADLIHLNLAPGLLTVDQVLDVLLDAVAVESALAMRSPDGQPVAAHDGYRDRLGSETKLSTAERFPFYDEALSPKVALVIATADQRLCANLLLTLGVRS